MKTSLELGDFAPIAAYCEQKRIDINPLLLKTADDAYWTMTFAPYSACYHVFAAAASQLRKGGGQLISASIEREAVATDATSGQVVDLLNTSRNPVSTGSPDTDFWCGDGAPIQSCSRADAGFSKTIMQMNELLESSHQDIEYGFEVVVGEDGPVFLRKSADKVPSALTLVPITVNGALYPAGSIARVDMATNPYAGDSADLYLLPKIASDRVELLPISGVGRVGMQRLSAFAAPPREREVLEGVYASSYFHDRPAAETIHRSMTIETIYDMAHVLVATQIAREVGRSPLDMTLSEGAALL